MTEKSRRQELQDHVDSLVQSEQDLAEKTATKKSLVTEYNSISAVCNHALGDLLNKKKVTDPESIEVIKLARTLISGYANILKTEHQIK